jgi:hypothetical protein
VSRTGGGEAVSLITFLRKRLNVLMPVLLRLTILWSLPFLAFIHRARTALRALSLRCSWRHSGGTSRTTFLTATASQGNGGGVLFFSYEFIVCERLRNSQKRPEWHLPCLTLPQHARPLRMTRVSRTDLCDTNGNERERVPAEVAATSPPPRCSLPVRATPRQRQPWACLARNGIYDFERPKEGTGHGASSSDVP